MEVDQKNLLLLFYSECTGEFYFAYNLQLGNIAKTSRRDL